MMKHIHLALFAFAAAFAFVAAPALAQDEPPAPPEGWTCSAGFYGTADGCDCGCGVADLDCTDATIAGCAFNGCADLGEGDAAQRQVPQAGNPTTCAPNTCGDGYVAGAEICDDGAASGCSADCTIEEAGFACGSNAQGCRVVVCSDANIDGNETCDDGNATAGDGCSATCEQEEGFSCGDAGTACIAIPAAWICTPSYFAGDDGCDCGCGALDPDCVGGGCAEASCGTDDEICRFCYDDTGTSIPNCGREGEGGEGEGEGEGNGGEGEGEGEGEGNNANGLGADPDVAEGGAGCASTPVSSSAMVALTGIAFAIARRRRR